MNFDYLNDALHLNLIDYLIKMNDDWLVRSGGRPSDDCRSYYLTDLNDVPTPSTKSAR